MTTLARILTGESATLAGRQAVLNVIQNRAKANFGNFGATWIAQAIAKEQFSAYPNALGKDDPQVEAMIQDAIAGKLGNIVPLSFNYANPAIMSREAQPDSWVWKALASGQGVEIPEPDSKPGNIFWANSQGGSPGYDPSKLWKGPTMTDIPASTAPVTPGAAATPIATIAGQIANDIDQFSKFEPEIAAVAGFIPGASAIVSIVQPFAPTILAFASRALHDIASSNGGDLPAAMIELMQHLTKGQPNSTTLS